MTDNIVVDFQKNKLEGSLWKSHRSPSNKEFLDKLIMIYFSDEKAENNLRKVKNNKNLTIHR